MRRSAAFGVLAIVALISIGLSIFNLERGRSGLNIDRMRIGTTPATVYRKVGEVGPLVVVAHGFAGSRQLMQAYSFTLAQSGYVVLAFDFEGHGRNPVPMSGDVTAIDGTTRLLVDETRRVLRAGRRLQGVGKGVALLGHSMATDILVRAAIAERADGNPVDAVVAMSMFSAAVSATKPSRLLAVSGEWEGALRRVALDAARQVEPGAIEGQTVVEDGVSRRAAVAPGVEHVGILFSATAIREARDWLDETFGRTSAGPIIRQGPWILLLLAGVVALLRPLVELLPRRTEGPGAISAGRVWVAVLMPAVVVPVACTALYVPFLPVLVADYLMIHLALYGWLQLLLLRPWRQGRMFLSGVGTAILVLWGVGVFGLAMDRYAASFAPNSVRLALIAVLSIGTVPFTMADSVVTGGGCGTWWRRTTARAALLLSLGGAAALDPERLMFLFIILPILLLFFLMHGLMGRWIGQRSGPLAAGLGLGLCLAWALGVTFPLFGAN